MADVAVISTNEAPRRKARGRRAALKDLSTNEISADKSAAASLEPSSGAKKGSNGVGLSVVLSPKKSRAVRKTKAVVAAPAGNSFADDLEELQARLNQLRLEKEKAEEMLKEKDEMLKQKEEEQEKLQKEFKKLQKVKEFKPNMSFPVLQSLKDKEQETKETKKKNKDLPEKKKPSPAYVLWCKDQWNEVKKGRPEAEFKEISNILGARWKCLSAEEKKPYEERYQRDKEAYLQVVGQEKRENEAMKLLEEEQMQKTAMELLEQYLQFKQETKKENKKKRKEKDPLRPKKPMPAFFLFSNERRAALHHENKSVLEIAKITGEEWKSMPAERRLPYEEKARKEKEEYTQRMELYTNRKAEEAVNQKKEEEEHQKVMKHEALQLLKKKEKTENIIKKAKETRKKQKDTKSSDPNKPKKPASSFLLFSKDARNSLQQERPGIDNSTLTALISVKWKDLNETERQVWNDKAAEAMSVYKKEVKEYMDKAAAAAEKKDSAV
ncbi:unnamed protein product [Spirodela intermedia]|uniref:HMG box domain-containing protein n=1 Tax=Spirodela intermedia TaxID=51605 RepID=A0A7I8KI15_SPIIN|nr:unnamed protein product [Spirodela intermedia]